MIERALENLNIQSQEVLLTPEKLKQDIPLTEKAAQTIIEGFAVE